MKYCYQLQVKGTVDRKPFSFIVLDKPFLKTFNRLIREIIALVQ